MPHQRSDCFFVAATRIAAGLDLQFAIHPSGSQLIAFPHDHSFYLRFALTSGAASAMAVEIVDEHGKSVADARDAPIYLLALGLSSNAVASLIQADLIEPYFAMKRVSVVAL